MAPNVKQMAYVTERISILHGLCQKGGFVTGGDARAYTAAWECHSDRGRGLPFEGIENSTHLNLLNEAATCARKLLGQLGWASSQLSPFIRTYDQFGDLADLGGSRGQGIRFAIRT